MSNIKASITHVAKVDAPLETVKAAITDPDWNKWFPFISTAECRGDTAGSTRSCTMTAPGTEMDGYIMEETIEANDKEAGSLSYSIQNPPLPVENLAGTVSSAQDEHGHVVVTWTGTFETTEEVLSEIRPMIIGMYGAGLAGLEQYAQQIAKDA